MLRKKIKRYTSKSKRVLAETVRRIKNPDKYLPLSFWVDYLKGEDFSLNDAAKHLPDIIISEFVTPGTWYFHKNCACLIQAGEKDAENADAAMKKGAAILITYKSFKDYPCIISSNPLSIFAKICRYYRNLHKKVSVTSVCGSIGKTTIKNMIGEVYKKQFATYYTETTFNAMFVAAFTAQHIPKNAEMLVQEVNEDEPGETQYESEMLNSDLYVMATIDKSHFSHFGSVDGIVEEICSFTRNMSETGSVVVNVDEFSRFDLLNGRKVISISTKGEDADFFAKDVCVSEDGLRYVVVDKETGNRYPVHMDGIYAEHNVICALYAFAAGMFQKMDPRKIVEGLEGYHPKGIRQNVLRTDDGVVLYVDCYNAVGRSMKSAISASDRIPVKGRRIAVLGDIEDVGEISAEMHNDVIHAVNDSKFDVLLTIGEKMRAATSSVVCRDTLRIRNYGNLDELAAAVRQEVKGGDLVLFKASHASHLEKCILKIWPQYTKDFGVYAGLFHKWRDMSLFN